MTGDAAPNIVVTSSRARLPAAAARHNASLSVRERSNRLHWLLNLAVREWPARQLVGR